LRTTSNYAKNRKEKDVNNIIRNPSVANRKQQKEGWYLNNPHPVYKRRSQQLMILTNCSWWCFKELF